MLQSSEQGCPKDVNIPGETVVAVDAEPYRTLVPAEDVAGDLESDQFPLRDEATGELFVASTSSLRDALRARG